jgi:limonene-1,2-epoxide hydrolase
LVAELIAARNAGSKEDVGRLLRPDTRYWDCLRGEVQGRDEVASVLTDPFALLAPVTLVVDTVAAEDGRAVVELHATATGPADPFDVALTEVYAIEEDGIAWCRAYLDPAELPGKA